MRSVTTLNMILRTAARQNFRPDEQPTAVALLNISSENFRPTPGFQSAKPKYADLPEVPPPMLRQLNSLLLLMTTSGSPFSTAALYLAAGSWQTVAKEFDRMKRSLLCALLSLAMICGATALSAQQDTQQNTASQSGQRGHQMMSPDQRLEHMTKTLDLNNEQQQNIKIILEKQQTDAQALRQDTSLSPAQRRAKMQELRHSTDQQINDILSPEQQQKWQQVQEQHTEQTGQGASAGQGMKPR